MSIEHVLALLALMISFGMFILQFIDVVISIAERHNDDEKKK